MLTAGGCASDTRFPAAPILLVCPWSAGGGSDRIARQLANLLEQDLDVPVNVINVTGGDGVTGHSRGALARPDGYTLTLITVEIAMLHWRQMTSISYRDFAPIGLVNRDAAALFVRSDAPWQTLRDLEQAIRARPGTLRASGTATAGIWHLALAGWLTGVGLESADVIWVSIAGSAPSLQELMAGGIDIVVCSLAEARALLEAGRVSSLGVMASERVPQFPFVPTLKEQGVDFSLGTLRALAVPREVPPDRIRTLAEAVRRVVHSEAYRSSMAGGGFTPAYEDPAQLGRTLEQTDGRLGALLRSDAFEMLAAKQVGPMFFPGLLFAALAGVTLGLLVLSRGREAAEKGEAAEKREAAETVLNAEHAEHAEQPLQETSAGSAISAFDSSLRPQPTPRARPSSLTARGAPPPRAWLVSLRSLATSRFLEPLLWIGLYISLAEWAGFLLTAGALLLVYLLRLGTRLRVALPVTLVLVPVTYYVFAGLLRVALPRGILGW